MAALRCVVSILVALVLSGASALGQTAHANGVVHFGSVEVGSSSATTLVSFTFETAGTLSGWGVFTQGAAGLDFTEAALSTTCSTKVAYRAGDSCAIAVHFSPLHPGVRLGAAQLLNASGNPIASSPLRGVGVGPQSVFPSNTTPVKLKSSIGYLTAVALDAAGDMFLADWSSGEIRKIVAENGQLSSASAIVTIATGFKSPTHFISDMKVDGAGNLLLAVGPLGVEEILAVNGNISTNSSIVTLGTGIYNAQQLALDGNGNIFVNDTGAHAIKKIVALNGQYSPTGSTVITSGPGDILGLAIDSAGNLYFNAHDGTNATIYEIIANQGQITPTSSIRTAFGPMADIAIKSFDVDAAGDLFLLSLAGIQKIPASGGQISPTATATYLVSPRWDGDGGYSVVVDASGNLFFAPLVSRNPSGLRDIVELPFASPPARLFPLLNLPRPSATIANNGNTKLKFAIPSTGNNPNVTGPFKWDAEVSTCKRTAAGAASAFSLPAGASCTVSAVLLPGTNLGLEGTITVTTDSLNSVAPDFSPQTVTLSIQRGLVGNPIDSVTHAGGLICQNDQVMFQGWAANAHGGAPVPRVEVLIDGTSVGDANLGGRRMDVAALLGSQYLQSGWTLQYPTTGLATGKHVVEAIVTDQSGPSSIVGSHPFQVTSASGCYAPFGSIDGALSAATRSDTLMTGDSLSVWGWAGDGKDGAPVGGGVQVLIDKSPVGSATLGIARPGPAAAYGTAYLNSGWTFTFPVDSLTEGAHTVSAIATDSLGNRRELSNWRTFYIGSHAVWGPPFGAVGTLGDSISGSATIAQSGTLLVRGWAADPKDGSPVGGSVQVLIDDVAVGTATLNQQRPQVAAQYGSRYLHSGFTFELPVSAFSLGTHVVQVVATDSLGNSTTLTYKAITIMN